mgnify:CR=1 FL=1
MNSNYKYKNILDMEKKYQNSFTLCKTNNIAILPPVLKKIGRVYFWTFLVIEQPETNKDEQVIKRPIGIICINNKNNKEIIYDLKDYDFCLKNQDFNQEYYNIKIQNDFWPNRTNENKEKFRICLDYLQKVQMQKHNIKGHNNSIYNEYLSKIKTLFPNNFWIFFEYLQKEDIFQVPQSLIEKRNHANKMHLIEIEKKKLLADKILQNKLFVFKNKLNNDIYDFCKGEIVPLLKGKGSYTKIKFYDLIGKKIKEINNDIKSYTKCYNPLLDEKTLNNNYEEFLEKTHIEIIKVYSKACNNIFAEDVAVDTIGKVLLVFLNALLIEEKASCAIDNFEEEITECISIFDEDNNRIKNQEARQYLTNIYNSLKNDYITADEEKLSDIYLGYIKIHNFQK